MTEAEGRRHARSLEYLLGLTAWTAGAVDIVSFTQLGGIFASAMTGNLAFMGLYVARGELVPAVGSLIALLGYVSGAAIAHSGARGCGQRRALRRGLGFESVLLAVALGIWVLAPHRPGGWGCDGIILLLAVAMGAQSIVGKQINLSNIPTVVFTSTLTNIVIGITDNLALGRFVLPADTKRQMVSFFLYFLGAFCAGLVAYWQARLVILLPLAGALAACVALGRDRPAV